jgi:hypothetical protein
MNQATLQQLNKMKALLQEANAKQSFELRGILSHFLQILSDVDSFSQFKRDFSMKLTRYDFESDKVYITNELKEIMKSSIDYYQEN